MSYEAEMYTPSDKIGPVDEKREKNWCFIQCYLIGLDRLVWPVELETGPWFGLIRSEMHFTWNDVINQALNQDRTGDMSGLGKGHFSRAGLESNHLLLHTLQSSACCQIVECKPSFWWWGTWTYLKGCENFAWEWESNPCCMGSSKLNLPLH